MYPVERTHYSAYPLNNQPFPRLRERELRAKIPSRWREFSFALHQLRQCIDPCLPLAATLANWNTLAADLSEPSRKRAPQVARFFESPEPDSA